MIGRKNSLLADRLVCLSTKTHETSIAKQISDALHFAEPVIFEHLLTGKETLPATQTRITFYGHGNGELFGGNNSYLPHEFVQVLIQLLGQHTHINEIDFLACNMGSIDAQGDCYASTVKKLLLEQGYDIKVNAFIVGNKAGHILKSFFVVGIQGINDTIEVRQRQGLVLLTAHEFSLDVLRVDNDEQVEIYQKIQAEQKQITKLSTAIKLVVAMQYAIILVPENKKNHLPITRLAKVLSSMHQVMRQESTLNPSLLFNEFLMKKYHFSSEKIAYLIKKYRISFTNYAVTCNIVDKNSYVTLAYPKDFSRIKFALCHERKSRKITRIQLANEFAKARSLSGRLYKDELSRIRNYLKPVALPGSSCKEKRSAKKDFYLFSPVSGNLFFEDGAQEKHTLYQGDEDTSHETRTVKRHAT